MLSIGKEFVLTKIATSKERSDEDFQDNEGLEAAVNLDLSGAGSPVQCYRLRVVNE